MTLKNTCLDCGKPTRTHFCLDCLTSEQAIEETRREAEDIATMAGVTVAEVVDELFPHLKGKM